MGMGLGGTFLPRGLRSITARGASPAGAAWMTPDSEQALGSCRSCLGKGRGQRGPGTPGDADPWGQRDFMESPRTWGKERTQLALQGNQIHAQSPGSPNPARASQRSPSRGTETGCHGT